MATTGTSTQGYSNVIENVVLTDTLKLNGPEWDNTLVRNVTILNTGGDGIFLQNVKNVRIENSTIHDVSGSGIRLSMSGSTSNVQIVDNNIYNIGRNGINAGQRIEDGVDHLGLQIIGNTVDRTGTSGSEGRLHGMYIQGSDFLIEGNHITDSTDGNAISVRTSGIIRDNVIEGTGKSGISYYADHMTGPSDTLVIENNVVMDTGNRQSRSDIDLLPVPDSGNVVHNFTIRNNTLTDGSGASVGVNGDYSSLGIKPNISGNTVVSAAEAKAVAERMLNGTGSGDQDAGGDDQASGGGQNPGGDDQASGGGQNPGGDDQDSGGGQNPGDDDQASGGGQNPGGDDQASGGGQPTTDGYDLTIKVRASSDFYRGAAKMQLTLDGEKVGDVQTVDANHARGDWSVYTYNLHVDEQPQEVGVSFLNDLYRGRGRDRDLWIDYVEVNGHRYDASDADMSTSRTHEVRGDTEMLTNGTITWDVGDSVA